MDSQAEETDPLNNEQSAHLHDYTNFLLSATTTSPGSVEQNFSSKLIYQEPAVSPDRVCQPKVISDIPSKEQISGQGFLLIDLKLQNLSSPRSWSSGSRSPIVTKNNQHQITEGIESHQYDIKSDATPAPKSGLPKLKPELDYLLPDTQIPSYPNSATNRTSDPNQILSTAQTTFLKANTCHQMGPALDSLLPDTQIGRLESNFVPMSNALFFDQFLPETQRNPLNKVLQSDEATLDGDILLPNAQRNLPLRDPASSDLPSTSSFLLEGDEKLPATQRLSASHHLFTSSNSNISNISAKTGLLESDENSRKLPLNKLSCKERKRLVVSNTRPPSLTKAMRRWIAKTHALLDPFPKTTIVGFIHILLLRALAPLDHTGKHSLRLNYGIASKLANHKMNKQQKDGFINKQWHLSHLCGNWTCLNPAHTTVEPGNINLSRNNCFSHRSGCLHTPPCMKDKKVPLGPDGKLMDHSGSMRSDAQAQAADDWDDWRAQGLDDGDDDTMETDHEDADSVLDDVKDKEFVAAHYD